MSYLTTSSSFSQIFYSLLQGESLIKTRVIAKAAVPKIDLGSAPEETWRLSGHSSRITYKSQLDLLPTASTPGSRGKHWSPSVLQLLRMLVRMLADLNIARRSVTVLPHPQAEVETETVINLFLLRWPWWSRPFDASEAGSIHLFAWVNEHDWICAPAVSHHDIPANIQPANQQQACPGRTVTANVCGISHVVQRKCKKLSLYSNEFQVIKISMVSADVPSGQRTFLPLLLQKQSSVYWMVHSAIFCLSVNRIFLKYFNLKVSIKYLPVMWRSPFIHCLTIACYFV